MAIREAVYPYNWSILSERKESSFWASWPIFVQNLTVKATAALMETEEGDIYESDIVLYGFLCRPHKKKNSLRITPVFCHNGGNEGLFFFSIAEGLVNDQYLFEKEAGSIVEHYIWDNENEDYLLVGKNYPEIGGKDLIKIFEILNGKTDGSLPRGFLYIGELWEAFLKDKEQKTLSQRVETFKKMKVFFAAAAPDVYETCLGPLFSRISSGN